VKIRSLIIDDDPFTRDLLQDELQSQFAEIEVVEIASSGTEGLRIIEHLKPELVFLDVEMGDMTGFEMLSRIQKIDFQVIFITSFDHYAIKAIHFNALDYLIKPIDTEDLKHSIERYKKSLAGNGSFQAIKNAMQNYNTDDLLEHTLLLHLQNGEQRIRLKDIVRAEGVSNYSYIHTTDKQKVLTSKTLGLLEEMLSEQLFFRCHKSHLVNIIQIKDLSTNTLITLKDNSQIPLSRRKASAFKAWFNTNPYRNQKINL
jgi:two-component system LytT family response regulator